MLIFVYGDDTFRVREKVKELRDGFVQKHDPSGLNTVAFSADKNEVNPAEVLQAALSAPFLGKKRMVIAQGVLEQTKADACKMWTDGLARVPDTNIVVLWETLSSAQVEKHGIFKSLQKEAGVHAYPFPALNESALSDWVARRIRAYGGSIGTSALADLVMRVGSDLWQMNAEIQKLVAYAAGKQITKEMVETFVRPSFDKQIFALVDAIAEKRPERAFTLLAQERAAGSADMYLMSMLARQVRILLSARAMLDENPRVSKEEMAQVAGINPFVASKALSQARKFTFVDLKKTHDVLFAYDSGTKSGKLTAGLAVDLITQELSRAG